MDTKKKTTTFSELIKGETPVLVDFYADWCGPCKMMKPILKDLKKKVGDDVTIIKIDVDRNQEAAVKYQIRGVPTLMLFKGGDVKWRQAGVVQANQLKSVIDQFVN
ncbi:MAG TPA: thioredoxin [Balneolaceae bacterium]|nr:thioredoxin [Balneolaceae bacterium]